MDPMAWTIYIIAWLVVLACGIGSVMAHRNRFTSRQRTFWIALMICVPFFGVLAYLPASLLKNGYSILKPSKKEPKKLSGGAHH
jgi:uncharacterized membrane protein YhaH (DUF805 family)